MNKSSKRTGSNVKAVGYTWVSKAGCWQVYQHFNNGSPDKLEWVNSEEDAKARVSAMAPVVNGK